MKEVTLFCKVGRAAPQALASVPADSASRLDAIEAEKTADLRRSGIDMSRVVFERRANQKGK